MRDLSRYPYGETLRTTSVSEFTLAEKAYTAHLKLPKHTHEQPYLCFVLGGSFTEIYAKCSRACHPSTLILNATGETHSDQFHASTRCFNIQMNNRWLERVGRRSGVINVFADFRGGRLAHLAAGLYREFRELDEFSSLAVEGLALEMLAEASRHLLKETRCTPPRWLKQVKEVLRERLAEHLSLVALAESVNVHPAHLAREFRRFYQCTVGEYVRQQRVAFACRQISISDAPLGEVALAAGFFDQSHFARIFKRYTGMTPGQYRTNLGGRKSNASMHTPCKIY
jgi:AraC family transcriptional regulator